MKTITEIGEDGLIAKICDSLKSSESVVVGPGDDCAVVGEGDVLTLLKTDAVVEGVHFLAEEKAQRVGWKSVARVLSDFAAMGGQPSELLVTIALPKTTTVDRVTEFYEGMSACLNQHGGVIVGGETTSLPEGAPIMISIAGRGVVTRDHVVTRSGGKALDDIYVTGKLGGSIAGKHLDFTPRLQEAAWLTQNFPLTAMMDLSDGLAKDLPRLAQMSQCGFHLEQNTIPLNDGLELAQGLNDGEDYELLFTVSGECALQDAWNQQFPNLPLTRIGSLVENQEDTLTGGWDHFEKR